MSARRRTALGPAVDTIAIALLVGVSAALFGTALGFYGADWSLLAHARLASGHGPLTPFSVFDAVRSRGTIFDTLGLAGFALAFACFGADPVGYHTVVGALAVGTAAAFYALLGRCGASRPLALAATLIFGFSSSACAARFSIAVPAYLGLAFLFVSVHAALSVCVSPPRKALGFALLALVAEYTAAFCCDLTAPLFLASAFVLARLGWASRALGAAMAATALGLLSLEVVLTAHAHRVPNTFARLGAIGRGIGASVATMSGVVTSLGPIDVALACAAGFASAAVVFAVALHVDLPPRRASRHFAWAGLGIFALGSAVFVAKAFANAASGAVSGAALVASVGAGMVLAGGLAYAAGCARGSRRQAGLLAVTVGIACACGQSVSGTVSEHWREAARQQIRLIGEVVERTAGLPRGAVVLIGGACPYADATPALRLVLGRDDVRADVVTRATRAAGYPFGPRTLAYDASSRTVQTLVDEAQARRFVATAQRELAEQCGPG